MPAGDDLNLVGATFAGVEIEGLEARGSRSVIYRGRSIESGRQVAVKVLSSDTDATREELERFEREARAASRLRHPNIVTIHRVGKEAGKPYLVMDYVMGKSLAVRTDAGSLPTRSAVAIIGTLASAIHHAHEQGIIHRDLKPENILFDEAGSPRISDFGLARDVAAEPEGDEMAGKIVGTPAYMPPEQAAGLTDQVDVQSDVYALGAILYEMLSGHPPFAAPTTALLLRKVREDPPPKPSSFNPDIHPDAETICLRAMERARTRRYASADMLRRDAEAFLSGKRIEAVPPGMVEHAPRWFRRHWFATAAVVIGALVAVFAGEAILDALSVASRAHEADLQRELGHKVTMAERYANQWRAYAKLAATDPVAAASAEDEFAMALSLYLDALRMSGGDEEVRHGLAILLDEGLSRCESSGDTALASTLREIARTHCPDRLQSILDVTGTIRIDSVPKGASARLITLVERGGRFVRAPDGSAPGGRDLGKTTVLPVMLRPGSYVLVLKAVGYCEARMPVVLLRGENRRLKVRLVEAASVPEGFLHVASASDPAGGAPVGPFLVARHEVTAAEYAAFIASLPAAEARRFAPRSTADGAAARAVTDVTAEAARRYCQWLSTATRRRFRLPTESEWRLAALGPGGWRYPWGDGFDSAWTSGGSAEDVHGGQYPVGSHPVDESAFGARDMAGGVAEWVEPRSPLPGFDVSCGGSFMTLSPELFNPRLLHTARRGTPSPCTGFRVVCEIDSK